MHEELHKLYEEDQADRKDPVDWQQMAKRDRQRCQRVEELIIEGTLLTAEDYFHAAMIFHHSPKLVHNWQAHELAKKAAETGQRTARWLAAAAYDRWLMRQGKPQKYGTQYIARTGETLRLWEIDPATTDKERAAWDVPPLTLILKQAARKNCVE